MMASFEIKWKVLIVLVHSHKRYYFNFFFFQNIRFSRPDSSSSTIVNNNNNSTIKGRVKRKKCPFYVGSFMYNR